MNQTLLDTVAIN